MANAALTFNFGHEDIKNLPQKFKTASNIPQYGFHNCISSTDLRKAPYGVPLDSAKVGTQTFVYGHLNASDGYIHKKNLLSRPTIGFLYHHSLITHS